MPVSNLFGLSVGYCFHEGVIMERRLATILTADIVGYSRLVEADEEAAIENLRVHTKAIQAFVASHNGRVFGSAGDSVIAEFASPVEAVRCAVAIQRDVESRSGNLPENRRMRFRIGVNLGDVVIDGDNLLGDAVNVAARLESLAAPNEIFISRQVYDQVRKQLPFTYENLGEHRVKNLVDPIMVYRVIPSGSPAPRRSISPTPPKSRWQWGLMTAAVVLLVAAVGTWWMARDWRQPDRGKFLLSGKPSVAVLSFDTFSKTSGTRLLGEGIADEIITQLARNSALTIIARTTTFTLKGSGLNAKEIGRKLNVQYVLEGSVRRVGNQLRITARLIDAKSGNHVWAERYDSAAATIFKTQDDIVEKIVGTLFSEIRETQKAAILRRPPSNLDVYELTLRGVARKHRLSPKDIALARRDLTRAVELDPDYAPAWLYLGWVEAIAIVFKWSDDLDISDLKDATNKVEKAIEMEPTLATAYQGLSILRTWQGDVRGALQAAKRSVELGPGDADNLLFLGRALASVGEFDQAVARMRHAIALNPIRPAYYDLHFARALWGQGKFRESNKASNACLTKAPRFTACRIFKIASNVAMGKNAEASKAIKTLRRQSPDFTVADALKSVGFPGSAPANERFAKQLTEAGLPRVKRARANK
ncbi:MAG: FlgO family outer membrane protein [Alphaproteobacteria bacterium]